MFRRMCDRCGELVVCFRGADHELTCARCGGWLVGPVALPTPETHRERCQVLTSPLYAGAVAVATAPTQRGSRAAA
jgi:hypothetical protein